MTATTRYGASWPDYDGEMVRIDAGTEVKVLHKAADQDGWNGGWICKYQFKEVCIEEDALKFNQE